VGLFAWGHKKTKCHTFATILVKATKSARHQFQDNTLVSPYPGAKEMILIPDITEVTNLTDLFELIKNDLQK
ncbi:hypothetical protein ACGCJ4_14330, partial [Staphylococcus aureus]